MPAPFILITTHHVEPERLAEFTELSRQYTEFIEANEPRMLAHYAYRNDDQTAVSLVQVHRDAASADLHLQLAGARIGHALALSRTARIDVFGEPGPLMQQTLAATATAGIPVEVKTDGGNGFAR